MRDARQPKGILRSSSSSTSVRSSELTSHMISPRMSGDVEPPQPPAGLPLGNGGAMAESGNVSGQLSSSQIPR
jgi:hypothetical protein